MAYEHPIGKDHPFVAVKALAEQQGLETLAFFEAYDGAYIRLNASSPDIVFRLEGDPGSAIDRQRFDYHKHVVIASASAELMLHEIKSHVGTPNTSSTARPEGKAK